MIDSPKQNNDQIIDPDGTIFKRTIELSQKEDGHDYKDFKSLNLYYLNSKHFNMRDFTKFDENQDQVNLIIYFNGPLLSSIPQDIDELILLLDSKSPDFNREDQIRIYMCQHKFSYVNISIDILRQILILIKKILLNESPESKPENETALLSLLDHKLDLREQESGSSPTISSDNSSPSLEILGDALLSKPIDGNTSFDQSTPLKINQENLFKFKYELHKRVTFNSKSYNIYNSPNNREITKISIPSNSQNSIKDCVKNSIKIAINEFNGCDLESSCDLESRRSNLLKSYEYLLIAIHSGGVKHEKIKYEKILTSLNGDSKRLNYEEAKELSKTFQLTCADDFSIYTGRIPNRQDFELVGMRTKRIPLELLIEVASEELSADEFEKLLEVVEKLKNFIVTDFSKRKRHREDQLSTIDKEGSTRDLDDTKKITTNPMTFFSKNGQRQKANSSISSPDNKGSLTFQRSSLETPEILYSTQKKRISSHLDNEYSLEKINLFPQSYIKKSQHLFFIKTMGEGFFDKKSTSLPEDKLPSTQYSSRGPKTVFSIKKPIERLKRDSVTADTDELHNRSQKRFPIIDFSRRAGAQKTSVMK